MTATVTDPLPSQSEGFRPCPSWCISDHSDAVDDDGPTRLCESTRVQWQGGDLSDSVYEPVMFDVEVTRDVFTAFGDKSARCVDAVRVYNPLLLLAVDATDARRLGQVLIEAADRIDEAAR